MSVAKQHTITKTIATDSALNYDTMFKEAIALLGEVSGEKWTNYNPSDPGITTLEFLCYALLDMGYKSTFPMKDILSNAKDEIQTENHLYTAREILFSNPVTTNDFRKLIIDRAEEVKNVWIDLVKAQGSLPDAYEVRYELSDELKAEWITLSKPQTIISEGNTNAKKQKDIHEFKAQIEDITIGVDALLSRHRNLGQIFFKPTVLVPEVLIPSGTIYFDKSVNVEEALANLYFTLNNYISTYITYYTYPELKSQGLSVGGILIGPRLENGFILDADLKDKLLEVDIRKLQSLVVNTKDVESVFSFNVLKEGNNEVVTPGKVLIGPRKSPFFNYFDVSTLIESSDSSLEIYTGEQRVLKVDQVKINAYYQSLMGQKAVSSFNFKNQLGPEVPEGQYRNIEKYHSLQSLFPEFFGLSTDHSFEGYSTVRKGQIKQLKAYLMLFEQIIADHQAQMANLNELLSFDSGVKAKEPLCKTYYSQGLYDSPGAEYIIKAFDVYKNESEYLSEHPDVNWNNFKKDEWNVYSAFLKQPKTTEKDNIERKNELLSHLYARLGQKFETEPIIELNPQYGDYDLARVEGISALLKSFSVYGENLGRSYFEIQPKYTIDEHQEKLIAPMQFFTGLEYKFDLLFQLNGYYKGIADVLSYYLTTPEDKNISMYPESVTVDDREEHFLVVKYHQEPILRIPQEGNQEVISDEPIVQYLRILNRMICFTKGFLLIDNQLLISNLQNENWGVKRNGQKLKFKKNSTGNDTEEVNHVNLRQAQNVISRFSKEWSKDDIQITYKQPTLDKVDREDGTISTELFGLNVSLFLLKGVCKVDDPDFLNTFLSQFAKEGPIQLNYNLYRMNPEEMGYLLDQREEWLAGNVLLQQGKQPDSDFIGAIDNIIGILANTKPQMTR